MKLGAPYILKGKKQHTVSRSLAEADYRSMIVAVAELTWVCGLLEKLNCDIPTPITLYSDNQAVIQIASNFIFHERTKHIKYTIL